MLFKITVLGEGGVGKTALTVQFTMASFVETYDPTIEDCYRKQWTVDDQPCLLEVLDTAGQEEYTALRDQWIRDGEGFLVVYSVCSRDTFERVEQIVKRVRRVKEEAATMGGAYGSYPYSPQSPQSPLGVRAHGPIPIVIIGNKRDMQHLRDVQPEEGANLARRLGCEFYETSAKHGYNVENAFKTAVRGIKVAKGIAPGQGPAGPGGPGGPGQAGRRRQKRNKNCVVL